MHCTTAMFRRVLKGHNACEFYNTTDRVPASHRQKEWQLRHLKHQQYSEPHSIHQAGSHSPPTIGAIMPFNGLNWMRCTRRRWSLRNASTVLMWVSRLPTASGNNSFSCSTKYSWKAFRMLQSSWRGPILSSLHSCNRGQWGRCSACVYSGPGSNASMIALAAVTFCPSLGFVKKINTALDDFPANTSTSELKTTTGRSHTSDTTALSVEAAKSYCISYGTRSRPLTYWRGGSSHARHGIY